MAARAFSVNMAMQLGAAGLGAVTGSVVRGSVLLTVNPNIRDLLVAAVGAVIATMGGPNLRAFGVGIGAVAVGGLIQNNILTRV